MTKRVVVVPGSCSTSGPKEIVRSPFGVIRDPRRAYRVVDAFEAELADYTGAPYAVSVDSCTNALYLALLYERTIPVDAGGCGWEITLPRRTYVGVLQAALNAGYTVAWRDQDWQDCYRIDPTRVVDSARYMFRGMYRPGTGTFIALSFHAAKQLPLGRGGAILTDNEHAVEWLQRARADGRTPGDHAPYATFPASHCYMPPDTAARGLWILSRWNDSGFEPAPLPPENYPDLSLLDFSSSQNAALSNSAPSVPERTSPAWRDW